MKVISRGELQIEVEGRVATVSGEALFPKKDGPVFVVFCTLPMEWEDGEDVTDTERAQIIEAIHREAEEQGVNLLFD